MQFSLFATVALTLAVAELPDKTMIATLVLGSRSRPVLVWAGAASAFVVQMAVAVLAGRLLALLPHRAVDAVVAVLFLGGAAYLLFVDEAEEVREGTEDAEEGGRGGTWKIVATAFAVIFLAEFGDLSQILVANFTATSHQPLTVFLAASVAMVAVSALGAFGGRALLRILPLVAIRRTAGVVLAILGLYTAYTALP